jgi:hypothetical protein
MKIALALLALGVPGAALAQDWRVVATSSDAIGFVDSASVRKTGTNVSYMGWSFSQKKGPANVDNFKVLVEASCPDKSFTNTKTTFFVGREQFAELGDDKPQHARPGTMIDSAIDAACTGKYESKTVPDPAAAAAIWFKTGK